MIVVCNTCTGDFSDLSGAFYRHETGNEKKTEHFAETNKYEQNEANTSEASKNERSE